MAQIAFAVGISEVSVAKKRVLDRGGSETRKDLVSFVAFDAKHRFRNLDVTMALGWAGIVFASDRYAAVRRWRSDSWSLN